MSLMASQITSLTIVYSTSYSGVDQRKHQSSASLAFVWGIHRDRWIPRTKGQLRGKCFHLMTSSWFSNRISMLQGESHIIPLSSILFLIVVSSPVVLLLTLSLYLSILFMWHILPMLWCGLVTCWFNCILDFNMLQQWPIAWLFSAGMDIKLW